MKKKEKAYRWSPIGDIVLLRGTIKKELAGKDAILRPKYEDKDFDFFVLDSGERAPEHLKEGLLVEIPLPYLTRISDETYADTSREDRIYYCTTFDIRLVKNA